MHSKWSLVEKEPCKDHYHNCNVECGIEAKSVLHHSHLEFGGPVCSVDSLAGKDSDSCSKKVDSCTTDGLVSLKVYAGNGVKH